MKKTYLIFVQDQFGLWRNTGNRIASSRSSKAVKKAQLIFPTFKNIKVELWQNSTPVTHS